MLFDLRSGKRRRVVQVVYSLLAVSFLIGFVFFGVGTGGLGSIADLFGGGSSGGSVSAQFDSQIAAANQRLKRDPKDSKALLKLADAEYQKGKSGVTQDPTTGQFTVSTDAHTELGRSADAWNRYLKVVKGKPDAGIAREMINVFIYLNDAGGAAEAARIVAADQPSSNSYGTLAIFLYDAGNIAAGDAAAKKAEAAAPKATRKQVQNQLTQLRKQAIKAKQQQAKAQKSAPSPTAPGANPLQSPLGGGSGP